MRFLVAIKEHGKDHVSETHEINAPNVHGAEQMSEKYLRDDPRRTVLIAPISTEMTGSVTIQLAKVNG